MMKFLVSTAVGTILLLSAATSSLAAGDYYEGASKDGGRSATDRIQTNSTSYGYSSDGRGPFGSTSRDNRQIGDAVTLDSGDYYEGASRPN